MIVKTIDRNMGLNPSSNGQLMKTDLEAGGLGGGPFATLLLGLVPQRVADCLGCRRSFSHDWEYLYAMIYDRAIEVVRATFTDSLYYLFSLL